MLISFDEIIGITLHHEGGYVHAPKDLGGETNYGIAKRFGMLVKQGLGKFISKPLKNKRGLSWVRKNKILGKK